MPEALAKLWQLLNAAERRSFFALVLIMLFEALLEMIGMALIPLYVTALAYPEGAAGVPRLQALQQALPVTAADSLVGASLALLAFFIAKALYGTFAAYWKTRFAHNRARKLSQRLFAAYLDAPWPFHLRHNASELLRNVNQECTQLAQRVLIPLVEFIANLLVIAGISTVLLLVLELRVLAWLALFLALGLLSAALLHGHVKRLGVAAQDERGEVLRTLGEGLGAVKELALLGRSGYFVRRLARALERTFAIQRSMALIQRGTPAAIELTGIAGLVGVTLMLLGADTSSAEIVATLSIFAVALTRMKGALRGVMDTYTEVRHHAPSLDVVHAGLAELEREGAPAAPVTLRFEQQIALRGLCYHHPGGHAGVTDIDLDIARGEAIGFVGETGAGKSTVLDLVLGVIEPERGAIRVDGRDIREAPAAWRRLLGYVPQTFFLVDGSVQDNIALGLEPGEIEPERVAEALRAASLDALVARLPEGLATRIGERGVRLSGGERQRIAIARALYQRPAVLVMDEATSALDNTTEAAVIEAVAELKGDRTILMVAHRLSTVRRCDRIVFLKHGRIEAVGSYESLLRDHPEFRRMATL